MKHLFVFLSRCFELLIVIVATYIMPAFAVGMMLFDPYLFVDIVRNPTYGAVMFFMCFFSVGYYISWKSSRVDNMNKRA